MPRPTILVTGAQGQIGFELAQLLAPLGNVVAADRAMLDLSDPDAIVAVVRREKPALIVNAGAYTAVDRAESEPGLARAINARAPGILAEEAKRAARGARSFFHRLRVRRNAGDTLSGGRADGAVERLRTEQARRRARDRRRRCTRNRAAHELGVRLARQEFPAHDPQARGGARRAYRRGRPDRRSELEPYARVGNGAHRRRRIARDGGALRAVPSFVFGRGELVRLRARDPGGRRQTPRLVPIATADYPTPARRPAYGVLATSRFESTFGFALPSWREALADCVASGAAPPH